jgi:translation initiation factor 3 subunit I
MGQDCELSIVDVRTMDSSLNDAESILKLPMKQSKITSMLWFLDETIITGHENGQVSIYDTRVSF